MAMSYCEAGETALGRLERAGDKWGRPPFRDKTMKGKKTRRNKVGNTDEHPPSPAGAGVPGWCSEGSSSPLRPDLANSPPLCLDLIYKISLRLHSLFRVGLLTPRTVTADSESMSSLCTSQHGPAGEAQRGSPAPGL